MPPTSSSPSNAIPQSSLPSSPRSWLQTPKPIRVLFSYFPLQTLPANPLPTRTLPTAARQNHTLFTYTSANSSDVDAHLVPSFNSTCLKWQTYLLMHDISFGVAASNNHASPSGALPFLIPAEETQDKQKRKPSAEQKKNSDSNAAAGSEGRGEGALTPIPASKLQAWIHEHAGRALSPQNSSERMKCDAYISLIEHRIRPAWVRFLNFSALFSSYLFPAVYYRDEAA